MKQPTPIWLTVHVNGNDTCNVYDRYGNHVVEYEGPYFEKRPIFDELFKAGTHSFVTHFFPEFFESLPRNWREILTKHFPDGNIPPDWRKVLHEA